MKIVCQHPPWAIVMLSHGSPLRDRRCLTPKHQQFSVASSLAQLVFDTCSRGAQYCCEECSDGFCQEHAPPME